MIVVTGATGNVGQPLVQALTSAGEEVRAVSRRGPFTGDLSDASSLRPAFEGASAVFLLLPGGFHGPLSPILSSARKSGVSRVVLLSSQGVGTGRHPANAIGEVTVSWHTRRVG